MPLMRWNDAKPIVVHAAIPFESLFHAQTDVLFPFSAHAVNAYSRMGARAALRVSLARSLGTKNPRETPLPPARDMTKSERGSAAGPR
jgi:hypothetical protein